MGWVNNLTLCHPAKKYGPGGDEGSELSVFHAFIRDPVNMEVLLDEFEIFWHILNKPYRGRSYGMTIWRD